MATSYGIVKSDGTIENPGTGDWSAAHPSTGQYTVTFDGVASPIASQPCPVVTPVSGNLANPSSGARRICTVTESGQDANGRWYFAVGVKKGGGAAADKGFSFIANG